MLRSGFFESDIVGYDEEGFPRLDRAEDAEFHAEYFKSFIGNGVFPNPADNFKVRADEGMKLEIAPGRCFINGFFAFNYESDYKTLDMADPILSRIDRLVLRLDLPERFITIEVKKGTPSEAPVPPPLTRPETGSADIYELGIADVLVTKNSVAVTQDKITDLRLSTEYCGIVHGTVNQVDLQKIFEQYETYLNTHIAIWDTREAQQSADWQAQMTQQADSWTEASSTRTTAWDGWFNDAKADIAALQSFNFDNWLELKGTTYQESKDPVTGVWTTTIMLGNRKLAERIDNPKNEQGEFIVTTNVYKEDGSILKTATAIEYKNADGVWIKEVV